MTDADWFIGELPSEWSVASIGYYSDVALGKMLNAGKDKGDGDPAPYLAAGSIQPNHLILDPEKTMSFTKDELAQYDLSAGDIVVVEGGAGYGRSHLLRESLPGWGFQNHVARVRAGQKVHPGYVTYGLKACLASGYIEANNRTATLPSLSRDVLRSIRIPLPPLDEQCAIAGYLDRETARIDTLIEEQQRLIEMLRGRRKAVIEQSVFSGLEGAPMTGNAEPWLPQTPCHWRVVQLGFVSDTLAGYAFPSDGFSTDDDHVRLLRGVNVKPGGIDWTDTVCWDVESTPIPSEFDLEVGDLVFGMDRPFVGGGVRVAAISGEDLPALLLQRVMRIRPNDEDRRDYMRYVMSTDVFFNYLEPLFSGVSVPHVSEWQVRKFKMPFPPLDEQKSIAAYLDEQVAKIDSLIEESERIVELSRERRSALITATVTGQVDVREMA